MLCLYLDDKRGKNEIHLTFLPSSVSVFCFSGFGELEQTDSPKPEINNN